jgi:hypothetical protein
LRVFFLLDVHVLGVDIGGGKEDNVMLSKLFAEAQGYDFTGKTYRYDPENFTLTDVSEED